MRNQRPALSCCRSVQLKLEASSTCLSGKTLATSVVLCRVRSRIRKGTPSTLRRRGGGSLHTATPSGHLRTRSGGHMATQGNLTLTPVKHVLNIIPLPLQWLMTESCICIALGNTRAFCSIILCLLHGPHNCWQLNHSC